MKNQLFYVLFLPFSLYVSGQNHLDEFRKLCQTKDTLAQSQLLQKWEIETPDDPELFTSYFNYYFGKGMHEVISMDPEPKSDQSFEILDSLGNVAAYMNSSIVYDLNNIKRGFEYIDKGIAKYPDRLDMRFGKIYTLGHMEDWELFTDEILKAVERSAENSNKWTWTNNGPLPKNDNESSKDYFLNNIQSYIHQIYNTNNNALLPDIRAISEKVLTYYPDDVPNLSNISITYLIEGQYDKALEFLLKAEKLDPTDYIVLGNIARAYVLMDNKEKAIEYYKKFSKYGDDEAKQVAKEQLKQLK